MKRARSMAPSAWKMTIVIGLAAVIGYFWLPDPQGKDLGHSAIGIASACCVVIGARRHNRGDRGSWYLIAGGILCFVIGDAVGDLYQLWFHLALHFPSAADGLYLAGYPLIIAGVIRLTKPQAGGERARESYTDAAIVAIGALALFWHLLMGSYAHDPTTDIFGKLVNLAYPVMDLGVLFIIVRGVLAGSGLASVHRLLAASMITMVVADFGYDLLTLHGSYSAGNPVDAGWLLNYVFIAAAALNPAFGHPPRVTSLISPSSYWPASCPPSSFSLAP